jgi:hypothetical protein
LYIFRVSCPTNCWHYQLFGDGIGRPGHPHELAKNTLQLRGRWSQSKLWRSSRYQLDFMGVTKIICKASFGSNSNRPIICKLSRSSLCLLNAEMMCLFVQLHTLHTKNISLLDPLLARQRRLAQAQEQYHLQVYAANISLLDKVLTQKDKPTRTTDIASSSTMEWAPKKAY